MLCCQQDRKRRNCCERQSRAIRDLGGITAESWRIVRRKFDVRHLGHVSDGYSYMISLGYEEAARICLTHFFNKQTADEYVGRFDTSDEEFERINTRYDGQNRRIKSLITHSTRWARKKGLW